MGVGRRASREIAMKLLYQLEIQKNDRQDQINKVINSEDTLGEGDREYILDIVNGVWDNIDSIDPLIGKYLKNWNINRIPKVDLSILRLSIYEIGFRNDIPFNVSINEAVELSKKYSTPESKAFVNGILGQVNKYFESSPK